MSNEITWQDLSVSIFGTKVTGIRESMGKKDVKDDFLYGSGNTAFAINKGNISHEGSITLYKFALDELNDAAEGAGFADITEVPPELITITKTYDSGFGRPMRSVQEIGVSFSSIPESIKQGDLFMECALPYKFLKRIPTKN